MNTSRPSGVNFPRISLVWRPFQEGALVLTYSRAYQSVPYVFRAMTFYHGGESSFPLQRSDQFNLSLRLRPGPRWTFSATLFYQWLRDLVRPDPTDYLRYRPTGRWEETGLEIELHYRAPQDHGLFKLQRLRDHRKPHPGGKLDPGLRKPHCRDP